MVAAAWVATSKRVAGSWQYFDSTLLILFIFKLFHAGQAGTVVAAGGQRPHRRRRLRLQKRLLRRRWLPANLRCIWGRAKAFMNRMVRVTCAPGTTSWWPYMPAPAPAPGAGSCAAAGSGPWPCSRAAASSWPLLPGPGGGGEAAGADAGAGAAVAAATADTAAAATAAKRKTLDSSVLDGPSMMAHVQKGSTGGYTLEKRKKACCVSLDDSSLLFLSWPLE